MNPDKKKNIGVVNDEVEELLKAAEDAALLKLNINADTVHGLSSDLCFNSSLRTIGLENVELNKKKNTGIVNDEVEELLRAAEDATLLKLNINAHTVHGSSSDLNPDLHQRFQALKSGSKSTTKPDALTKSAPPPEAAKVKEDEAEDDLFARFSALKASLPKPSPCTIPSSTDVDRGDNEEEDEVEKVIRWAMDAARLDPSLPSDEDDNIQDDDNYDESVKSDEDDRFGNNQKAHQK